MTSTGSELSMRFPADQHRKAASLLRAKAARLTDPARRQAMLDRIYPLLALAKLAQASGTMTRPWGGRPAMGRQKGRTFAP